MDWKKQLAEIGDEYLIGLTNKGIVKRAYKDKETAPVKILKTEEEASLQVDGETVILRIPLGESMCSCPSRSICKHIILGVLVLKEQAEADSPGQNALDDGPALSGEAAPPEAGKDPASGIQKLREEINAFPEKELCKVMGARRISQFLQKAKGNIRPEIRESSVFTLQIPGEATTVKLLSPLEYSSCTCHKKDLCIHKAEAIFWCKLKAGVLSLKNLEESQKKDTPLDTEQIRSAANQMKEYLEELMATGLSRISPDVTDSLERFAILSHNTGLPNLEKAFRSLVIYYESYLNRQASFRTIDLMRALCGLYGRVTALSETEDPALLEKETGEFRAEYVPVGDLTLLGITMEHFDDAAGYEGETVYFLEADTKEWYTYTLARPVFYDTKRKWGKPQKSEAPWGLNLFLEKLIGLELRLKDARCDTRKRLSSSKETRGEILGAMDPGHRALSAWYYEDFGKLFADQIPHRVGDPVFLQPSFCDRAVFSKTEQSLSMTLYDGQKREVILELAYSKEDAGSIRYLERIREDAPPCFIGKVFLRDGRIRLVPIDVWKGGI